MTTYSSTPTTFNWLVQAWVNEGADTLTLGTGGLTNATVGGGKNGDSIAITAGNIVNSLAIGGGGADTILLDGTYNLATVQSSDGHDRINATGLSGSATLVIASGKGYDSIALGTATIVDSVAGGLVMTPSSSAMVLRVVSVAA